MIKEEVYYNRETKQQKAPKNLDKYYAENGVIIYSGKELEEKRKEDWKESKSVVQRLYRR